MEVAVRRSFAYTFVLFLTLSLAFVSGCSDTREGSGTDEGDACSAPTDCDEGFDCIERECLAVENDECDCRAGLERCIDGVCEQVEVVTATLGYENSVGGAATLDGASATICTRQPVRSEPNDEEILLRDDECIAYRIGAEWQSTHEAIEANLGVVTLATNDGDPVEVPQDDSELAFLRGCYTAFEGYNDRDVTFRPGDELQLSISGNEDFPQLTLDVTVPEDIHPTARDLVPGEPLLVTWQPAADADASDPEAISVGIRQRLESGRIGSTFIACRAADDGEFAVPAEFIAMMPEDSGRPVLQIARRNTLLVSHEQASRPVFIEVFTEVEDLPISSE